MPAPAATATGLSGSVRMQVLIETDGTVFSAQPLSGHPLLKTSARVAACRAKFAPSTLKGQPVRVSGTITYNFVK